MSLHPAPVPELIRGAGACMATRNVMEERGRVRWMVRDPPQAPEDSGWRFFSEFDSEEYINDPADTQVVDYISVCVIEPAVIAVYPLPVGSDIERRHDGRRITLHDAADGGRDITAGFTLREDRD